MLFAHISGADSLREISQGMASQSRNLNHWGIKSIPSPSALSYANAHRPYEVFKETFEYLVEKFQPLSQKENKPKPNGLKTKLFSVDSTTIDLCLSLFPWAKFRRAKGAVKLHTVLDHDSLMPKFVALSQGGMHDVKALKELILPKFKFPEGSIVTMDRGYIDYGLFGHLCRQKVSFVTRLKDNTAYQELGENSVSQSVGIIGDTKIELTGIKGAECPHTLRRVVVYDPETKKTLDLLTNNFKLAASTIGLIYKARWQIELFFKQLKQSLKIKTFVGTSENAVKVQIYSALCALVLLRHIKNYSDSKRGKGAKISFSFSNMVMLVRLNMFQYINMMEWIKNPFIVPTFDLPDPNQQSLFGQQDNRGGVF
jgi:hypothetical protein